MPAGTLSPDDLRRFQLIINDLTFLFQYEKILVDEIDTIANQLNSDEAKAYLNSLRTSSKPEIALREAFFAGPNALLSKFIADEMVPESDVVQGFIDYRIGAEQKFILLELKSLFERETKQSGRGKKELIALRQKPLKIKDHVEQILKYVRKGGEFVIVTNLREWYFFNDYVSPDKCEPFYHTELQEFAKELPVSGDLFDYLQRRESKVYRQELDQKFFESLKSWADKLMQVQFDVDDKLKTEMLIGLVNKFIFIQTLDDYDVIDFRWIKTTWEQNVKKWKPKGTKFVLDKFLRDVNEWFYLYYDTELFMEDDPLKYVSKDQKNLDKFYQNLELILGVLYWQTELGGYRGIIQYNFRYIDEDIFGKAYETYLADVRHDEAIYYTPAYIREYILRNTLDRTLAALVQGIADNISSEKFDDVSDLIDKFISIKVLDPACGSGSFLVKATKIIMKHYHEIKEAIITAESGYTPTSGTLDGSVIRSQELDRKIAKLEEIRNKLKLTNNRELINVILLRHIYGNDLDRRAIEVAKVNLWLEAIKLSPPDFKYQYLHGTNHILPNLTMNLNHGDSVMALPDEKAIELLSKNNEKIKLLWDLRNSYLQDSTKPENVVNVESIRTELRDTLDLSFKKYLEDNEIPVSIIHERKPLHWSLEFWFLYFDIEGKPLPKEKQGVDILIGNPPYERIQVLQKKSNDYVTYLDRAGFKATESGNYDLAVIFIERGYELLSKNGVFGYIVTNKFMQQQYGIGIRRLLSSASAVSQIVDFGDQQVFDDATTYTAIIFLSKKANEQLRYALVRKLEKRVEQLMPIIQGNIESNSLESFDVKSNELSEKPWVFLNATDRAILAKLANNPTLKTIADSFVGLQTSADRVYILEVRATHGNQITAYSRTLEREVTIEKAITRPLLKGSDIQKWVSHVSGEILIFPYSITYNDKAKEREAILIDEKTMRKQYPATWEYFELNRATLEARESRYLFTWNEFTGAGSTRIKQVMKEYFNIELSGATKITKDNDNETTVSDGQLKISFKLQNNTKEVIMLVSHNSKLMKSERLIAKTEGPKIEVHQIGTWVNSENWYGYIYLKNMDKFDQPKIINQVLAHKASFGLDDADRFYFVGGGTAGGYGLTLKENSIVPIKYLLSLLNSSLLDWQLRKKTSRFHSGFYVYAKDSLEPLYIKVPTSEQRIMKETIESNVDEIIKLTKARKMLLDSWRNWSEKMKGTDKSLAHIMKNENAILKSGGSALWFKELTFYTNFPEKQENETAPNGDSRLDIEYDDFELYADPSQKKISILALHEDRELTVFEFVFNDNDWMETIYLCLLILLESRAKVKSIRQLFEKTEVPLIQFSDYASRTNIIKKVKSDFENTHQGIPASIIAIDASIKDYEARNDVMIFNLYGLDGEDTTHVLNRLPHNQGYIDRVLTLLNQSQ